MCNPGGLPQWKRTEIEEKDIDIAMCNVNIDKLCQVIAHLNRVIDGKENTRAQQWELLGVERAAGR